MNEIVPSLPLSLEDLQKYYLTALHECKFLEKILESSIELLKIRMKPSALVSVRFNSYESYFCAMLEHLKWRVSPICVDPSFPISKLAALKNITKLEYKHSGVAHPIKEEEINSLLSCLGRVVDNLEILIREIDKTRLKSIFMCHSSEDKKFATKIARDLIHYGAKVWIDEAEIKIGDSLIQKIQDGIYDCHYLGVILSKQSVQSEWVKRELEIALNEEMQLRTVKVLPLLIEDCEIPGFLSGKLYADFRKSENYNNELKKLLDRLKE